MRVRQVRHFVLQSVPAVERVWIIASLYLSIFIFRLLFTERNDLVALWQNGFIL